jgi:hypothetical protein
MGFPFVFLFALPVGLLIGAVILRAAVSMANKCVGGPAREPDYYDEDEDEEDWDGYMRPRRGRESGGAIPEPTLGRAMGIVLVSVIAILVVTVPIRLFLGLEAPVGGGDDIFLLAQLITLVLGFVISAGVLAGMLPTSFARGCLVALFEYLIVLGVVGLIAGILYMVFG